MCGIAGFIGYENRVSQRADDLRRMCGAILHRGPDEEGLYTDGDVALGMRRLCVIDVNGGTQPIANEDGTVHVVFNGEIYNHKQIRSALAPTHDFATRSDTEAIVHLYEERGQRVVDGLRGMFAFALWDSRRQQLLLARDRLGIKPLYYWATQDGFAFASELRCLIALPQFTPRLDHSAIAHYLTFGYVPEDQCVLAGVRKLAPGHRLTVRPGEDPCVERYWSPVGAERASITEDDAVAELRELLRESVELHLDADVPVGAFLSGGIDSSAVVAQMCKSFNMPVRTFSIGFGERGFDESAHAASTARTLGTIHTELIARPDVDDLVDSVIAGFDEPFADASALPTFLVSQLARQHVTVALSGDGGDELFGGYDRYSELLGRRQLIAPARRMATTVGRALPAGAYGRNRLLDLGRTRQGRYAATVASAPDVRNGGIVRPALSALVPSMDNLLAPHFAAVANRDFASQMTLVDVATYLPGDILTKVDRMSMSVSLEARVPLLDHHVVEFALSLPSRLKHREGVGKWIFRRAITGLVPNEVFHRPKHGFSVPLGRWLRHELSHRVESLLQPSASIYEFVDRAAVARIAAEHSAGRRDHSSMIWRLLVLEVWLRTLSSGDLALPSPLAAAPLRRASHTPRAVASL